MSEQNDKDTGFKITDKRFSSRTSQESIAGDNSSAEKIKMPETEHSEEKKKSFRERLFGKKKPESYELKENDSVYSIDFSSFILSLGTQAMMHLGEIPNPLTQEKEKDLSLAKQTIDLMEVLKEKTKGNLTPNEEHLLENLLYELRMKYVKEAR